MNSETKHTEGPWKIEYDNSDNAGGGQWYNVGPAVIRYPYNSPTKREDEAKANANLIAAAPDMSAILEEFLADCNEYWGDGEATGRAMRFEVFEERMMAHSQDAEAVIDKTKGNDG